MHITLDLGPLRAQLAEWEYPEWSLGQPRKIVGHAWQAQQRLHRRYRHLVGRGKRVPVVVVALARELTGFV